MRPRRHTPPLDMEYLHAARGRWKYLAWAGFVAAGLAYFTVSGLLSIYCLMRYGPVAGIFAFNGFVIVAVILFRMGMARARKRRDSRASREREP